MRQRILLSITIILLISIIPGCTNQNSKADQAPSPKSAPSDNNISKKINLSDLQRSNGDTEIAMLVTFLNPLGEGRDSYLSFEIWLNNHKIDLATFPMGKNAKLYDFDGNLISTQPEWETEGVAPHLTGYMNFKVSGDTNKLGGIKLVIENLGITAKREFTWDKEYLAL